MRIETNIATRELKPLFGALIGFGFGVEFHPVGN